MRINDAVVLRTPDDQGVVLYRVVSFASNGKVLVESQWNDTHKLLIKHDEVAYPVVGYFIKRKGIFWGDTTWDLMPRESAV